jgi:hypothetical protein
MAWRDLYHYQGHLWVHQPDLVFQCEVTDVNSSTGWGFLSVTAEIEVDITPISGALADVKANMMVVMGTFPGDDSYGRVRVRDVDTVNSLIKVWCSYNNHDGEMMYDGSFTLSNHNYVTVYDDRRVWMKPPAAFGGYYYYDGESGPQGCTYEQIPIANCGLSGYIGEVDGSGVVTVSLSAAPSFAVADDAVLGAYTADIAATYLTTLYPELVDANTATYWEGAAMPSKLAYFTWDFGAGNDMAVRKFAVTGYGTQSPQIFALLWSDDNSEWLTAFQGNETGWGASEKRTFYAHDVGQHRYWRFQVHSIEAGWGNTPRVREFELYCEDRTAGTSPWSWDVGDGTITVGSTTTQDITATFPDGCRYVELSVTDTNGETGTKAIPVVGVTLPSVSVDEIDYTSSTQTASTGTASRAFNNSTATFWITTDPNPTGWLQIQFPVAHTVIQYDMDETSLFGAYPTAWIVEGSNDGSAWTLLDTHVGQTFGPPNLRTYTITSPAAYTYYRISISASTGTQVGINEWNLYERVETTASDGLIEAAEVVSHTMEQGGQVMEFAIHEAMPKTEVTGTVYEEVSYSGALASASTGTAANAFDNSASTVWAATATPAWIQLNFSHFGPAPVTVTQYGVLAENGVNNPTAWTFAGSTNGSTWTTLDTQSGISWTGKEEQTFVVASPGSYDYYRLTVTATGGSPPYIYELNLYKTVDTVQYVYPDGALVMYFEREVYDGVVGSLSTAGPSGAEHVKFIGWIDEEPTRTEGQDLDTISDTTLRCVDVGGRLQQLIDFSIMAERDDTPAYGYQMKHANIDTFIYLILRWLTTAAEIVEYTPSFTADLFNCDLLGAQGGNIFEMIDQLARAIGFRLGSTKSGGLCVAIDPMVCVRMFDDRVTTGETILASDMVSIEHTHSRTSHAHWVYGGGVGFWGFEAADASYDVVVAFSVAPGTVPGQGVGGVTYDDLIEPMPHPWNFSSTAISELFYRTGRMYAQENSEHSTFDIELVWAGDTGLDPAVGQWVNVTLPATVAAQRGLTLDAAPGLIRRVDIDHNHEAQTKTVRIEWEMQYPSTYAMGYTP